MTMRNAILEKEIPYEKLAKLGISREQTLSMPKDLLEPLLSGKVTPLVQAHVRSPKGDLYSIPLKLQLVRDKERGVLLMTYPVRLQMKSDLKLNQDQLTQLNNGEVIRKEVRDSNGTRHMQFIQMDMETKSLIRRNAKDLKINDQIASLEKVKDIQLGQNQKDAIKEGKPVELEIGDQKVTVGLDNREPNGFKVVNGDMDEWNKQQKIRYDLANEGFMGYVMTDQNRWEYQQVVDRLAHKDVKQEEKIETKERISHRSGLRMG